MSIAEYLGRLEALRRQLAENILSKGVETTASEPLSSLVPKVLQISGGGGEGGGARIGFQLCRDDRCGLRGVLAGEETVAYLESDTLLNPSLELKDFEVSGPISNVTYVNENLLKLTLENAKVGDTLSVKASKKAYLHKNGTSTTWTTAIENKLEDYYGNTIGMTYVRKKSKNDSGVDTIKVEEAIQYHAQGPQKFTDFMNHFTSKTFSVSGDSWISPTGNSNCSVRVNQQDNASYTVGWMMCNTSDCGRVLKIRWEGFAYYNDPSVNQIWEMFLLPNGDAVLFIERYRGSHGGGNGFFGYAFAAAEGGVYSFYAKDWYASAYDMVMEEYNPEHHNPDADSLIVEAPLAELIGNHAHMAMAIGSSSKQDDNNFSFNLPFPWRYHGADCTSLYISGNSWMGLGSAAEHIRVNRRDAALYESYARVLILTDMTNIKCLKITWKGASSYSGSIDQEWELYLFENGDAMLYLTKRGSSGGGTYSFFNKEITLPVGQCLSLYRKDTEGTDWEAVPEIYDPDKHLL